MVAMVAMVGSAVHSTHSVVHESLKAAHTLVLDLPEDGILALVGTSAT